MSKRLLVITYYFPPCARSGVQRSLRLAKYLPKHGIEPVFIVPEKARCRNRYDPGLMDVVQNAQVHKVKDPMPFKENELLPARAVRRVWNKLLWPDGHRYWAKNAARLAIDLAKTQDFHGVFATGFPFSGFLAGGKVSGQLELPLFLDYRDPWSGNPSMKAMPDMEGLLIKAASRVFCATQAQVKLISSLFGHAEKFSVFPYSYEARPYKPPPKARLRIGFAGNHYGDLSPFETFLKGFALAGLDAEFVSRGTLGPGLGSLVKQLGIEDRVSFGGFLKQRDYWDFLESCHIILVAQGIPRKTEAVVVAAKFLDALAVGRPVLYMGTPGVNWNLVQENHLGFAVDREDPDAVAKALSELSSWPARPVSVPELEAHNVMREFSRQLLEHL